MILTSDELRRLVELKHRSPHSVLGMHPLPDGSGLVVRSLLPHAAKVEVHPMEPKAVPAFELLRIHDKDGVFEGTTTAAKEVYAYELAITDAQGQVRRTRDPYSFLPTLSEEDLYLFGKGDERQTLRKARARNSARSTGVAGTSFAVWAPNAQRISVVGDFNNWDGRIHPMRSLGASGVWEIFIPGVGEGAHLQV